MKHILVTGGCGYVGTVLTQSLLAAGHRVTAFDIQWFGNKLAAHPQLTVVQGDIRDIDAVPMAGIDVVMHLANVANDPCADLSSKLNWEVNVLATKFLAEKAIAHGVKQFIFASSGSVYGVKSEPEVTEELSLVPISDYNKTKMCSERVLLSYADRLAIQIIRPATVCGFSPRMRLDLSVNILTWSALKNGKITVFGGAQSRPNIHLRDMVQAYHHFLARPDVTGIFNAGFENLTILEIAQLVTKYVKAEILTSPSNDPRSYRLSSKKLLATGFKPTAGVEDAIRELVEAHRRGDLKEDESCFNIRAMKSIPNLA